MTLNCWTKQDEEEFQNVLKATKSIEKLYQELYRLELNNKQDSLDYKKRMEYLDIALDIEYKKYSKANFNSEKKQLWESYIFKFLVEDPFLINYESIIVQNHHNKSLRRILCRLNNYFLYYEKNINELVAKDLQKGTISSYNVQKMVELINNSVSNDLLRGHLYYLNKLQRKTEYQSLKKYFVSSKYYLSFINKDMEQDMIKSNFKLNDEWYIESPFIADLISLDREVYTDFKNLYGFNIVLNSIYTILVLRDLDYSDNLLGSSALIMQSFIKSGLNMIDKDKFLKLKKHYEHLINEEEYQKNHLNDNISIHLVDECLNRDFKKDSKIYCVKMRKK